MSSHLQHQMNFKKENKSDGETFSRKNVRHEDGKSNICTNESPKIPIMPNKSGNLDYQQQKDSKNDIPKMIYHQMIPFNVKPDVASARKSQYSLQHFIDPAPTSPSLEKHKSLLMTATNGPITAKKSIPGSNQIKGPPIPQSMLMGPTLKVDPSLEYLNISRKRSRTIMSANQSRILRKVLETTSFPSTELRENLAKILGMKTRTVQIWFQNQRQKAKQRGLSNASEAITAVTPPISKPSQEIDAKFIQSYSQAQMQLLNLPPVQTSPSIRKENLQSMSALHQNSRIPLNHKWSRCYEPFITSSSMLLGKDTGLKVAVSTNTSASSNQALSPTSSMTKCFNEVIIHSPKEDNCDHVSQENVAVGLDALVNAATFEDFNGMQYSKCIKDVNINHQSALLNSSHATDVKSGAADFPRYFRMKQQRDFEQVLDSTDQKGQNSTQDCSILTKRSYYQENPKIHSQSKNEDCIKVNMDFAPNVSKYGNQQLITSDARNAFSQTCIQEMNEQSSSWLPISKSLRPW